MDWRTPEARQRYGDLVADLGAAVVCLDFDGVLAPIVDDPDQASILPGAGEVLVALASRARAVAVVTGRPARQAVALGDLEAVARRIGPGGDLMVLGQYGNERWVASTGELTTPERPEGLDVLVDELPDLLRAAEAEQAHVEHKSLAVAVHTRRLPDPQGALERILPPLRQAAERHGLVTEPGRMVVEVRASGMDKGDAVRALHEQLNPKVMMFAGDDLGDVEAFRALAELREQDISALLVCSGSEEQRALVELADVVVDGPEGVLDLLRQVAADAGG